MAAATVPVIRGPKNAGGTMNRGALAAGAAIAGVISLLPVNDAAACGGCFQPPVPPTQVASDITDERMLLTVSPTQTTLYDQIEYSGSPSSFAWVLPIHGTVTVGLSADILFDVVDALTATQVHPPPSNCPPPPNCSGGCGFSASSNAGSGFGASKDTGGTVSVTKQQNVGPYATVQLHATDSSALDSWLAQNNFEVPDAEAPVIAQYVAEGFDFLAMKLLPDESVKAMRPVRVTSTGASFSLPLRMAAIGTGATVGITIWVLSDGRYEPQNFPFFHIADSDLIWDWSTSLSNYTTLRAQDEAALSNKGWEIESSITLSQALLVNGVLTGGTAVNGGSGALGGSASDPSQDYLPVYGSVNDDAGSSDAGASATGSDAGGSADSASGDAGGIDGGWTDSGTDDAGQVDSGADDGGTDDGGGSDAGTDSVAIDAGTDGGAIDAGALNIGTSPSVILESAEQVRADDLNALLAGIAGPNVRVTRIRSDIAHAAMNVDLVLQASADQSELSNVRQVSQSVNESCPIYDGCNVVGTGTPAQSAASEHGGCAATTRARSASPWSWGSVAALGVFALLRVRRKTRRR